jgi:hypothetical protein
MEIYMKRNFRLKRTTKQYITVAVLCLLVIGGAACITAFVVINQIKEEYQTLLNNAYQDMAMNKRNVYMATEDIKAGDALTVNNLERATVYSSQPQESYITQKEIGKLALIDIPAATHVLATMITEHTVSSELREMEYQVISISSNIESNDTVDVRIVYPNGESYIVLSKKMMKGVVEGSLGCYLWMNEEEILRMSAAIVDAALYTGSQLITTKYIEPAIQEASRVTYTPSIAILSLLEKDPNILERCSQELTKEIRKALENRLASSMTVNVSDINWKVDPNVGAVDLPKPSPEAEHSGDEISSAEQKSDQYNIEDPESNSENYLGGNSGSKSEGNAKSYLGGNSGSKQEGNAESYSEGNSGSKPENDAESYSSGKSGSTPERNIKSYLGGNSGEKPEDDLKSNTNNSIYGSDGTTKGNTKGLNNSKNEKKHEGRTDTYNDENTEGYKEENELGSSFNENNYFRYVRKDEIINEIEYGE